MFARIVSAVCIAYVALSLLTPPCLQLKVDAEIAMLAAPPGARDAVAATAFSADIT